MKSKVTYLEKDKLWQERQVSNNPAQSGLAEVLSLAKRRQVQKTISDISYQSTDYQQENTASPVYDDKVISIVSRQPLEQIDDDHLLVKRHKIQSFLDRMRLLNLHEARRSPYCKAYYNKFAHADPKFLLDLVSRSLFNQFPDSYLTYYTALFDAVLLKFGAYLDQLSTPHDNHHAPAS